MKKVLGMALVVLLAVQMAQATEEVAIQYGTVISTTAYTNRSVTLTNLHQNVGIISIDMKWFSATTTGLVDIVLDNGVGIPIVLLTNAASTGLVSYVEGAGVRRWKNGGTVRIHWNTGGSPTTNYYVIHSDLK